MGIALELGFVIPSERSKNKKRLNKFFLYLPELTDARIKILEERFGKPKFKNEHLAEAHRKRIKMAIDKFLRYRHQMLEKEPSLIPMLNKLHGDAVIPPPKETSKPKNSSGEDSVTSNGSSGGNSTTGDLMAGISPLQRSSTSSKTSNSSGEYSTTAEEQETTIGQRVVSTDVSGNDLGGNSSIVSGKEGLNNGNFSIGEKSLTLANQGERLFVREKFPDIVKQYGISQAVNILRVKRKKDTFLDEEVTAFIDSFIAEKRKAS